MRLHRLRPAIALALGAMLSAACAGTAGDRAVPPAQSADALYLQGLQSLNGRGVPQDDQRAAEYFSLAAKQGDARAQNNLGVMLEHGRGLPQDYAAAASWYRKAAAQGLAIAQHNLAALYHAGHGVPQDHGKAVELDQAAAAQNLALAQYGLGKSYELAQGVPRDFKQAAAWYRKAADQDDAPAEVMLASFYFYGEGVELDYDQALAWYHRAQLHNPDSLHRSLPYLELLDGSNPKAQPTRCPNSVALFQVDVYQPQRAIITGSAVLVDKKNWLFVTELATAQSGSAYRVGAPSLPKASAKFRLAGTDPAHHLALLAPADAEAYSSLNFFATYFAGLHKPVEEARPLESGASPGRELVACSYPYTHFLERDVSLATQAQIDAAPASTDTRGWIRLSRPGIGDSGGAVFTSDGRLVGILSDLSPANQDGPEPVVGVIPAHQILKLRADWRPDPPELSPPK